MHPIERLRYVARATDAPADDVVREAAGALAGFADDPVSLVTACRRLIDRHPANGPIWWLCARTLRSATPADEPWRCADEFHADPTIAELGYALPDAGRVAVVGWADRLAPALVQRGDVEVFVIDVDGDGQGFSRQLERLDVSVTDVDAGGAAAAVAECDVVLVDVSAFGPDVVLVERGNWSAAAVAHAAGVAVWAVGGRGRVVPGGLWPALEGRLGGRSTPPWERRCEHLPQALVDRVAGPTGLVSVAEALAGADTPDVAELRR